MMKRSALAVAFVLGLVGAAEAQTPRKGGTLRMTAPYGSSFSALDIRTSVRAQDGIWAKAIHRTLFNWDSDKNAIVRRVREPTQSTVKTLNSSIEDLQLTDL